MCLILLAREVHPRYRLIVAANRDEFYARPSAPLAPWQDSPDILAGRDLQSGGTWMGVTRGERFAAVTNYRDPASRRSDAKSRGQLVSGFLGARSTAEEYAASIGRDAEQYNSFNLIVDDGQAAFWFSDRGKDTLELGQGIHAVSNHLIDTPWPKVEKAKHELEAALALTEDELIDRLLEILADETAPPDDALPDTGVGLEWERILSPVFITSKVYGTRSSSVLLFDHQGGIMFVEQSFEHGEKCEPSRRYSFSAT